MLQVLHRWAKPATLTKCNADDITAAFQRQTWLMLIVDCNHGLQDKPMGEQLFPCFSRVACLDLVYFVAHEELVTKIGHWNHLINNQDLALSLFYLSFPQLISSLAFVLFPFLLLLWSHSIFIESSHVPLFSGTEMAHFAKPYPILCSFSYFQDPSHITRAAGLLISV